MKVSLHFGAMSEPIQQQLIDQGFRPPISDVKRWQKLADSIVMLTVHSYIGERETQRLRKKLLRQVVSELP